MENKYTSFLLMSVLVQDDWYSDTAVRCKLAAVKASATQVVIISDGLVTTWLCPVDWGETG